jgi:hypothetical protein
MERRLSKSRLIDLRQCAKRLWLEVYRRELREDDPSTRARMDVGNEVGVLARTLHDPDGSGKLFDAQRDGYEAVFETSQRALGERRPLFEAGYRAGPVFAFVDVLLPDEQGEGWKLVEVKSSVSVKPYHRDDLAVQVHILQEAGVRLTGAAVACIDSSWVYPGGSDYRGLLKQEDLFEEARARGEEVRQWAVQAQAVLRESEPPAIEMGAHCQTPFACPYTAHCTASAAQPGEPVSAPVQWLPQVRTRSLKARLAEPGVVSMEQVDDALLNDLQRRVKRATLTGEPWADPGAASEALSKVRWPLHFLDFEAVNPAVPRWAGTRPFQQIPFQYSLHVLHEDGRLEHREFLDLSGEDPRPALARQLLRDIPPDGVGTVLAYNASFEGQVLGALAQFVADAGVRGGTGDGESIALGLRALRERLMDLLPVARSAWYHPAQQGSWSIKRVLPTLTEGAASYDDLEDVADGQQAVQAYLRATSPGADAAEVESIRQALRRYCEQDTRAMVALWGQLVGIARGAP